MGCSGSKTSLNSHVTVLVVPTVDPADDTNRRYKPWHCSQGHVLQEIQNENSICTRCQSKEVKMACESDQCQIKLCEPCFTMKCDGSHGNENDATCHRLLRVLRMLESCTLCKEFDGIDTNPTLYSCHAGCSYHICEQCYMIQVNSKSRGARGSFIRQVMQEKEAEEGKCASTIESNSQPSNSLPSSKEVVEFVSNVNVLFSFASSKGGLSLSKYLRTHLLNYLYPKGATEKNEKTIYIDCVALRNRKETTCTRLTNANTGKEYIKIENPHWAEFYYASMLFVKTVVVIFDAGWLDSGWCRGEWQLFLRHSNALFENVANDSKRENAYRYKLIVCYQEKGTEELRIARSQSLDAKEQAFVEEKMEIEGEVGGKVGEQEDKESKEGKKSTCRADKENTNIICWSESLIRTKLREMEVNESMLQGCVMIPATINDDAPSMRTPHLNEFINVVKDNNCQDLEWENMEEKQKLEGVTLIYNKYWKQAAIDAMRKH